MLETKGVTQKSVFTSCHSVESPQETLRARGQRPKSEQPDFFTTAVRAGFPGDSAVVCLLMQETWVRSLSLEDPLEKEMAAHSRILIWRITEEPGGL